MTAAAHIPHRFRRALRDRHGGAALEFAFLTSVLVLIMLGVVDLGNAAQQTIRLETAARAGAQYALGYPRDRAGIEEQVRTALAGWTDITIAPAVLCCVCPTDPSVTCDNESRCSTRTERYMTISVTRPFRPLLVRTLTTLSGRVELRFR